MIVTNEMKDNMPLNTQVKKTCSQTLVWSMDLN